MSRRVVITGMAWITPLGHDVDAVWRALLAGESAIGPVTRFDASTAATSFAAEVRGFRLPDHVEAAARHRDAGLSSQFALAAAARAWRDAGLDVEKGRPAPRRIGLYLGAGEGSLDFDPYTASNLAGWDAQKRSVDTRVWARTAYGRMSPRREIEQEPNVTLAHIARALPVRGPSFNCMTACAASTQAAGEAFEMIRRGDADIMLAGGAHSMIHPLGMAGFIRLTAMSTRRESPRTAARPFDATRDGFVMGEGAGIVVLESLDSALRRGREPLCEVAGFGSTADAFRITDIQPEGKGAAAAMGQALRQAGINPREPALQPHGAGPTPPSRSGLTHARSPVHYISAHGTGTKENDSIETAAVKSVFGPLAPQIPFSSVKSMLGHLIQAAGAVELITCIQAIRTGWVPPTINLKNPDPACDLDHVPNTARDLGPLGGVDVCLSNSFGFGGQNDTICVRRFRA